MIMGIHRTVAEWDAHPQGLAIANIPVVEIIKIGESDPYRVGQQPGGAALGHPCPLQQPCDRDAPVRHRRRGSGGGHVVAALSGHFPW